MFPLKVSLDRLIIEILNVTEEQFSILENRLSAFVGVKTYEHREEFNMYTYFLSPKIREYKHNLKIGFGDGGLYVGFMHNSSKKEKYHKLKIEFNPNKFNELEHAFESGKKIHFGKEFFKILYSTMNDKPKFNRLLGEYKGHIKTIKGFDIAFDYPIAQKELLHFSTTGRQTNRFKGTEYYGERNKDGYLKMYDKKKEKSGSKLYEKYNEVTRIEYSFRMTKGVVINEIREVPFSINDLYKFQALDVNSLEKLDSTVKAHVLCVLHKLMPISEMTRTYKDKVKKALEDMQALDLDHILKGHWEQILNDMKKYLDIE